jgi:hypothetical protein
MQSTIESSQHRHYSQFQQFYKTGTEFDVCFYTNDKVALNLILL